MVSQHDQQHTTSSSEGVQSTVRVRRVITARAGGQSTGRFHGLNLSLNVGDNPVTVTRNRERLAENLGLDLNRFVWMDQIEGPHVQVVEELSEEIAVGESRPAIPNVDALVTTCVDMPLVVLTADAVPVLLGDDEAGVIAAINASKWGVRAGILSHTLDKMRELGARIDCMHALLGPSATGRNYLVSASEARDIEAHIPHSTSQNKLGKWMFDLRSGITHYLLQAGIAGVNVDPRCTIEDHAFYSTIREGKTGRQAGIIWRSTT